MAEMTAKDIAENPDTMQVRATRLPLVAISQIRWILPVLYFSKIALYRIKYIAASEAEIRNSVELKMNLLTELRVA